MLLDSSAWIAFLGPDPRGDTVWKHLKEGECVTAISSLAEIAQWARRSGVAALPLLSDIAALSTILPLDAGISFLAGDINHQRKQIQKKWGMLDSLIMATALAYDLPILTTDSDFRDVRGATILK